MTHHGLSMITPDWILLRMVDHGWPCVLTWLTMHKPWWHHVKTTCVNHAEAIVKLNVKTMVKQWYVYILIY